MKLSTFFAKLTCSRTRIFSALGGLALAGAALTLGAPAANAQFAIAVHVGHPRYVAPAPMYVAPAPEYIAPAPEYVAPAYGYVAPGYWNSRRDDDWRRHEDRQRDFYARPVPSRDRR